MAKKTDPPFPVSCSIAPPNKETPNGSLNCNLVAVKVGWDIGDPLTFDDASMQLYAFNSEKTNPKTIYKTLEEAANHVKDYKRPDYDEEWQGVDIFEEFEKRMKGNVMPVTVAGTKNLIY